MHIYRLVYIVTGKYIQRGFLKRNPAACAKNAKPLLASCVMKRRCSANQNDQFLPYGCMVPVQPGPNRCRHHHSDYRINYRFFTEQPVVLSSFLRAITTYSTRVGYNHSPLFETWPAVSSPVTVRPSA